MNEREKLLAYLIARHHLGDSDLLGLGARELWTSLGSNTERAILEQRADHEQERWESVCEELNVIGRRITDPIEKVKVRNQVQNAGTISGLEALRNRLRDGARA